jgi:ATP-dependent RNA helicase RhlE
MFRYWRRFSTFEDLRINQKLVQKLTDLGMTSASPAQESLIPVFQAHSDLLLKDETGSGKTLGLCISILNKTNPSLAPNLKFKLDADKPLDFVTRRLKNKRYLATIFMVPTRELGLQVRYWMQQLDPECAVECVYAGVDIQEDMQKISKTPEILIGTPRRLWELLEKKVLDISHLQTLVVDEIDRIVEPIGKYATVKQVFNRKIHPTYGERCIGAIVKAREFQSKKRMVNDHVKSRRLQVVVSSATANSPLRKMLRNKRWMNEFVLLDLNTKPPQSVSHIGYYLDSFGQLQRIHEEIDERASFVSDFDIGHDILSETIAKLCHQHHVQKGMIVTPATYGITNLVMHLKELGLSAARLSDLVESHERPFESILEGDIRLMLASDAECRGLDIPILDHVISFGYLDTSSYLHVSGRAGRFGRKGTCISVLPSQRFVNRYLKNLKLLGLSVNTE